MKSCWKAEQRAESREQRAELESECRVQSSRVQSAVPASALVGRAYVASRIVPTYSRITALVPVTVLSGLIG